MSRVDPRKPSASAPYRFWHWLCMGALNNTHLVQPHTQADGRPPVGVQARLPAGQVGHRHAEQGVPAHRLQSTCGAVQGGGTDAVAGSHAVQLV